MYATLAQGYYLAKLVMSVAHSVVHLRKTINNFSPV